MDTTNYITESRKHKHLNFQERLTIQLRLKLEFKDLFDSKFNQVFKTITADNGLEAQFNLIYAA